MSPTCHGALVRFKVSVLRFIQIPSVVKNVLEKPIFHAGLVWTLGLNLALKLRF